MRVMWVSSDSSESYVQYGTAPTFGQTVVAQSTTYNITVRLSSSPVRKQIAAAETPSSLNTLDFRALRLTGKLMCVFFIRRTCAMRPAT